MTMSLAGPAQFVSPVVLPPVLVTRASTSKALRPFAAPAVFPPSTMLGPLLMFGFIFFLFNPLVVWPVPASGPRRCAADVHDRAG
jgi:hypothetical protein